MPKGNVGDWFAVPLPKGGYGLCLLARKQKRRGFCKIFVYVFGPRVHALSDIETPIRRHPEERTAFTFTFDDSITNGRWQIVDHMATFRLDHWPLPPVKSGPIGGGPDYRRRFELVEMSDDLVPGALLGERLLEDVSAYPDDLTHGYLAFEEFVEDAIAE